MIPSNDSIDAKFSVSWTHRLRFTDDSFAQGSSLNAALHDLAPVQILTVVDSGVQKCNSAFMKSFSVWQNTLTTPNCGPIVIEGGETTKKNMDSVGQVLTAINDNNLCRKSCVLVIGGGALLDAVGFAASTAHRGIPIIRMPSTTLAQCDSGVGVKNAVNYFGKKNFIGVFDPPHAVVNDSRLLTSLDDRHWRSGLSEAVKVALIKDATFFKEIEQCAQQLVNRDQEAIINVIKKSAILHLEHITNGGDPFERLNARPLDFGHWSAHKLEQITGNELTHGEAVSIGLAIDVGCSVALGFLDESVAKRVIALLQNLGLPTSIKALEDRALIDGIEEFRQHLGGPLTLLMIKGIAEPVEVHELDELIVRQVLAELL